MSVCVLQNKIFHSSSIKKTVLSNSVLGYFVAESDNSLLADVSTFSR